jgi:hypothetical protein
MTPVDDFIVCGMINLDVVLCALSLSLSLSLSLFSLFLSLSLLSLSLSLSFSLSFMRLLLLCTKNRKSVKDGDFQAAEIELIRTPLWGAI